MRIQDVVTESTVVREIERLPASGYEGGKEYLRNKTAGKQVRRLPGGSGLLYSVTNYAGSMEIKLWDPGNDNYQSSKQQPIGPEPVRRRGEYPWDFSRRYRDWQQTQDTSRAPGELVGKLELAKDSSFPIPGALKVGVITVDEDYRGQGLARALYGIVLSVLRRPLLAGDSQTPGGRRNWLSLSQIPGVEMKGYFALAPWELDPEEPIGALQKQAQSNVDTIMGQLGGQYIGQSRRGYSYWAFDVQPNTTKKELEAAVKTKMNQVYGDRYGSYVGLYAVWTGQ